MGVVEIDREGPGTPVKDTLYEKMCPPQTDLQLGQPKLLPRRRSNAGCCDGAPIGERNAGRRLDRARPAPRWAFFAMDSILSPLESSFAL